PDRKRLLNGNILRICQSHSEVGSPGGNRRTADEPVWKQVESLRQRAGHQAPAIGSGASGGEELSGECASSRGDTKRRRAQDCKRTGTSAGCRVNKGDCIYVVLMN